MAAFLALIAVPLLLLGLPADASLVEAPDAADEGVDFDATLHKLYDCDGSENLNYHWLNPVLERISPDVVAVSADLEIKLEIPDVHTYSILAIIENIPGEDENERVPIATLALDDICNELKTEQKEGFRNFRESMDNGDQMQCPIAPGMYKINKLEMSVKDSKPFLQEGRMLFTVKQMINATVIGCNVIEFIVHMDVL